jgi:5-methylcytosine-specific restriction endonuclease McrA
MTPFLESIHRQALLAAGNYRKSESELLEILIKVLEHKVYFHMGYTSLFDYSVKALKLSEGTAYHFIGIAKKSKEVPEIKQAIDIGKITISNARRIVSVITPDNKDLWIEKAASLKQRELEMEIVKVHPKEFKKEIIRPIAEDRLELKIAINQELENKLRKIQNLISQKTSKPCSLEEAIDYLSDSFLKQNDPVQKAERILSKRTQENFKLSSRIKNNAENKRLPIPSGLKHEVNQRDRQQCTYIHNGSRCSNQRWLQLHHIKPIAIGGENKINNLTTLCSGHHKFIHEKKTFNFQSSFEV